MTKLGERDTHQTGLGELLELQEHLTKDTLSVYISCMCQVESGEAMLIRKESVRILGELAKLHRDNCLPYLGKMVSAVAKRLKDKDSVVRLACSETMGCLAEYVVPPNDSSDSSLGPLMKPLFGCLSEQNKYLQNGAALCIQQVLARAGSNVITNLHRLAPRLLKFINNPNSLCRPELFAAVSNLVETCGEHSIPYVPALLSAALDGLVDSDWNTRKASVELIEAFALNLGAAMSSFVHEVLDALEQCRLDKVKPVREAVAEAIHVFADIPDSDDVPTRHMINKFASGQADADEAVHEQLDQMMQPKVRRQSSSDGDEVAEPVTPSPGGTVASTRRTWSTNTSDAPLLGQSSTPLQSKQVPVTGSGRKQAWREYGKHNNALTAKQKEPSTKLKLEADLRRQAQQSLLRERWQRPDDSSKAAASSSKKQGKQRSGRGLDKTYAKGKSRRMRSSTDDEEDGEEDEHGDEDVEDREFPGARSTLGHMRVDARAYRAALEEIDELRAMVASMRKEHAMQMQAMEQRVMRLEQMQMQQAYQDPGNGGAGYQMMASSPSGSTVGGGSPSLSMIQGVGQRVGGSSSSSFGGESSSSRGQQGFNSQQRMMQSSHGQRGYVGRGMVMANVDDYETAAEYDSLAEESVFTRSLNYLVSDRTSEAYGVVLDAGDELTLVRLMGRTGPVLHQLDLDTICDLFTKLIECLQNTNFVDKIMPWVEQAIELEVPFPEKLKLQLAGVLQDLSGAPNEFGVRASALQGRV